MYTYFNQETFHDQPATLNPLHAKLATQAKRTFSWAKKTFNRGCMAVRYMGVTRETYGFNNKSIVETLMLEDPYLPVPIGEK
jgi:hypothetical protein